jgi:two-component system copper resistance phosphate regulon response regulator CusR
MMEAATMRILLVEDEEKVSRFIMRGLVAERFAVDAVFDGTSGLEYATTYSYDLIILDLMLPGLGGTEVLRQIRRRDHHVPVLVLTARDTVADKVENFETGADDYLTKPFAFAELLVRIKALLRRGPVSRASVLRIANLELDRLSQQVRRAGRRIELTSKEYALLEYLMANAGRVLSRTMIIDHVWDESFDGLTNIVDVYVRHLRNKVDEQHERKLIRTVRGVGYTISDEVDK